jgi:hypothetical protein
MELWDQVGSVGSVASIIGAIISIYVLLTVRKIENQFLFRVRVPEILKALKKNAGDLNEQLRQFESSHKSIEIIFSKVGSILKNLVPKISGSTKKSAKIFAKKLQKAKGKLSEDLAWALYTDLNAMIEELKQYHEDIKWH